MKARLFSRTDRSFLARWWWTIDRRMLGCFLLLAVLGVMLVMTASPPVAERIGLPSYYFVTRHLMMLFPALLIMFAVSLLEARALWRLASVIFVLGILAMIAVPFTGMEIKGATRWIHVFGLSIQPSEFVKPAFAIVSGWFMALGKKKESFPGYLIATGLYVITAFLLLMQPDLGMTCVVTMIWVSQIFLAGFPFRLVAIIGGLGTGGLGLAYLSFSHVHSRIDRFLHPDSGDNYQVQKSVEAFQHGGLFGAGPGQGTVKLDLPDAHADFIFSVAGEELGLAFLLILIAIYGFIVLRGFKRLEESENIFMVLAAGGLLTMIGMQALVHMGSALNILPAKGMTLPFISYGGSSILSIGFAMGAILALTRRQATRGSISKAGLSLKPKAAAEAAAAS